MNGREPLAGRYELRGLLGRGGMAEVHDGWDTRLNRAVAIKLLYPAISVDADARRRFEDEARAAASLNHPNIVAVHDRGEHRGAPFIVMERLPGRTLADEIAAGPIPQQRVRLMLHDVLGALGTAHRAGIVHRDVKPGNVLLTENDCAMKVADFGIAKSAGAAHTVTGQIVGTAAYMSPERVAGAPASVADDLYAVGIMAHEALTGRRPYPQENPASLIRAIMDGPPPPIGEVRPGVDPALAAVIDAATAPEGACSRFGSADEMYDALSATPVPPRPATKVLAQPLAPSANYYVPARARRKPMTRNRKLLLAAAAFVGVTVAILALAVDPSSTTQPPQPVVSSTAAPPPPPSPSVSPAPSPEPVVVEPAPPPGKKGPPGPGRGNGHKKD